MKFDFCIGNPPYHEETRDTSDKPIYNKFMDAAFDIGEKVELITPSRFLFDTGKTPKDWNKKILNDDNFKVLHCEQNSKLIFPGTDIKGGVVITYRDKKKKFGAIEVYTSFDELNSIRQKVWTDGQISLNAIMNTTYKFNLEILYKDHPEYKNIIGSEGREKRLISNAFDLLGIFHDIKEEDDIEIAGIVKMVRTNKYINKKYIDLSHPTFKKYKVIVPASNGSGAIGEVLSTPLIGEPLIGFTQTFISIGCFVEVFEATACFKYIKTKFARAMLGIKKNTQSGTPDKWKFVPLQDFTENSDIDWTQSISDIDKQLYKKYGLSQTEIDFIESKVKSMDNTENDEEKEVENNGEEIES